MMCAQSSCIVFIGFLQEVENIAEEHVVRAFQVCVCVFFNNFIEV